jgi:hypothetical protein
MSPTPSFSLARPALVAQLLHWLGLERLARRFHRYRFLIPPLIAWLPLFVITSAHAAVAGTQEGVPFSRDFAVHVRLLLSMPLLIAAEGMVNRGLAQVVAHFFQSGIVVAEERSKLEKAAAEASRWGGSVGGEVVLLIVAYADALFRSGSLNPIGDSSWRTASFAADFWYRDVALPMYGFLVLRWLWWFVLWVEFLWHVSRLRLHLVATHPDAVGGLGVVSVGHARFALLVLALSITAAGQLGERAVFQGASLTQLQVPMIGCVVAGVAFFLAPLVVFSPQLLRARQSGLVEFGAFVYGYVQAFQKAWIEGPYPRGEAALGSADIQSLADAQNSYSAVRRMKLVLVDANVLLPIAAAAILPMVPVLLVRVPLQEAIRSVLKLVM